MRAKEIITNENVKLFEINMSPRSLQQLASGIDTRAGMEFEMVVPVGNFIPNDANQSTEPDYTYAESAQSIDDIEIISISFRRINQ